ADAVKYVGKSAAVCGLVASAAYAVANLGTPTYLNLDKPYPNQPFTVIIWGEKRNKFPTPPETAYNGKRICVTGTITAYHEQPQMVITGPSQIKIE
ncbi:MAG TPA: DNA-binding protein, partial [Blastocatellia bacterium]|nr:DNA-binding protein [Blastocatellia bacterium]